MLLSAAQLDSFRKDEPLIQHTDERARRGARLRIVGVAALEHALGQTVRGEQNALGRNERRQPLVERLDEQRVDVEALGPGDLRLDAQLDLYVSQNLTTVFQGKGWLFAGRGGFLEHGAQLAA